jgi:ubiquinone/menaquinone biosynthesis C-methylase UbiE
MKPESIELLRSPISYEPLRLVIPRPTNGHIAYLEGVESGERFPIFDGIPWLIDQSEVVKFNRKYQRLYDVAAPFYDAALCLAARLGGGSEDEHRMEYIRELEVGPGDRFLEVSIGTGTNIKYLPASVDCYGLDISRGMLGKCQKNLKRWRREAELFLGNAEALPFKDEQFDSVLHVGGINAFNDRRKAIDEMIRVAKPGSKIVIVDENATLVQRMSWLPGAKSMMKKYGERFQPPVSLVPEAMQDIDVRDIVRGSLYCLSFRKPAYSAISGKAVTRRLVLP